MRMKTGQIKGKAARTQFVGIFPEDDPKSKGERQDLKDISLQTIL